MIYKKNLISVIIPTYKRKAKVLRAIDSVIKQTYKQLEIIVVNDNNPGDVYTVFLQKEIYKINDLRLSFIIPEKHINGAVARNTGIKKAKGEFIAFLDDDDLWLPNKLELQINELKSLDSTWGGVGCKNFAIFENNIIRANLKYKDGLIFYDILLRNADVSTDAILLRRESLDEMGYFDENLKRHQEVQLLARFTSKYKLRLLDKYLVCVDIEDNQNRPEANKLWALKLELFSSLDDIMMKLTERQRKRIYIMHKFELGGYEIKNGQFFKGLTHILNILKSPLTTYYAFRKIIHRVISSKFQNQLVYKDIEKRKILIILNSFGKIKD